MKKIIFILLLITQLSNSYSQSKYVPSKSNLENRAWFDESRLGIFIHWGVYSLLGDGEWAMNNQGFSVNEYALLPKFFNPTNFNAKDWAKLFKQSGAKYITFTSRHHDGFSMWNSNVSDFNVVKSTPYAKDVTKELVDACRAEGLKVMFYYSLLDWRRNDYLPVGETGKSIAGRDDKLANWDNYIQFMKDQLTELLTNYGQIDGIWFDGHWDKKKADWKYDEIYSLIHKIQPQCLIGNNHHITPFDGEDFQMFERDLPGQNKTGFGTDASHITELPKEVCGTIAGSWGFDIKDRKQKSFKEVLSYLIKAAGFGSNLLLNVGPMPNGEIQDYQQDVLEKLGVWLSTFGGTIYGTSKGPIDPTDQYAITKLNAKTYYLHLLATDKDEIHIPNLSLKVKALVDFENKNTINYTITNQDLIVKIPENVKSKSTWVLTLKAK